MFSIFRNVLKNDNDNDSNNNNDYNSNNNNNNNNNNDNNNDNNNNDILANISVQTILIFRYYIVYRYYNDIWFTFKVEISVSIFRNVSKSSLRRRR